MTPEHPTQPDANAWVYDETVGKLVPRDYRPEAWPDANRRPVQPAEALARALAADDWPEAPEVERAAWIEAHWRMNLPRAERYLTLMLATVPEDVRKLVEEYRAYVRDNVSYNRNLSAIAGRLAKALSASVAPGVTRESIAKAIVSEGAVERAAKAHYDAHVGGWVMKWPDQRYLWDELPEWSRKARVKAMSTALSTLLDTVGVPETARLEGGDG